MKLVKVKKEGYMLGAEDESAELLHQTLGYRLYSAYNHIKTGFPIIGYETVKRRLLERNVELFVEDMSEEEIHAYIVEHGYAIDPEEENEILFVLNCLLEGTDPTNGLEIEKNSFIYDALVQRVLWRLKDIVSKPTKKKKKAKLGANEATIRVEDFEAIVDEDGEIKTDLVLFYRLRMWRQDKMKEERMAGYMIFHDKTLVAFATYLPKTKYEFLNIYGAGEGKWEKYGEEIIQLITNHIAHDEIEEEIPF
jgi:hypothetical protein